MYYTVYVFSPCASSAYNKSSGRKTRTGSRRQRDHILVSPMVICFMRHQGSNKDKSQLVHICAEVCTNLHPCLDSVIGLVPGHRRLDYV